MEAWKHLRAVLLLPFMVAVVIPGVVLWLTGPDTLGLWQSVPATRVVLPVLGGALACLGLVLILASGVLRPWPHGFPRAARTQPTVRKRMSKPPPTTRRRSGTLTSPATGTRTISRAMTLYGASGA